MSIRRAHFEDDCMLSLLTAGDALSGRGDRDRRRRQISVGFFGSSVTSVVDDDDDNIIHLVVVICCSGANEPVVKSPLSEQEESRKGSIALDGRLG